MDEINYRRITSLPKQRCEDCGATAYLDPDHLFRCVVCDHDRFEVCLDCGYLSGWCQCPPPATRVVARPTKKRATRTRPKLRK